MNDTLKLWRAAHGKMNQKAFADLVGTTQPHISAIENGDAVPSLALALRIFDETGIGVGPLSGLSHSEIAIARKMETRASA